MGSPDGVRNERSNPNTALITRRVFSRFMAGRGLEYTTAAFLLAAGALQLPKVFLRVVQDLAI